MSFTSENLRDIKARGDLDSYIAHEKGRLESLLNAEFEDDQKHGIIKFGYLHGSYGDNGDGEYWASTSTSRFSKSWPSQGFASHKAALAYARAALRNEMAKWAADCIADARENLQVLESAKEEA